MFFCCRHNCLYYKYKIFCLKRMAFCRQHMIFCHKTGFFNQKQIFYGNSMFLIQKHDLSLKVVPA